MLLGLIGATCFAASGAGAAPAPHSFSLTIRVTATANYDHTSCKASLRAVGMRTATFHSSRPTLVRFAGGRLRPVVVRGLTGTVNLSGTNTQDVVCTRGETPAAAPEQCPETTRTFANGRMSLSSTAPGSITTQPPRVAWRRIGCPQEPDEVVASPLGIAPGRLHISVAALTSSRTTRITLTASARQEKRYGPPESGFLQERTVWRLKLVRTGR